MTTMAAPTGSGLNDDYEPTPADALAHTAVSRVSDPALREVLYRFDHAALGAPLVALRGYGWHAALMPRSDLDVGVGIGPLRNAVVQAAAELTEQFRSVLTVAIRDALSAPIALRITRILPWEGVDEQRADDPGALDAVAAVKSLRRRLGVSQQTILDAVGISKSTFSTWDDASGRRPRVASQGRLWELFEVVAGLESVLGAPLRPWLLADSSRVGLLRSGRFDALAQAASLAVLSRGPVAPEWASSYAVGADLAEAPADAQDCAGAEPTRAKARRTAAASVGRRRRT